MTQGTREVSWGDGLVVAAFKAPGGLKAAVDRIQTAVGRHIGSRNTFAKLLHVENPDALAERDRFRAWLLLAALDEEPADWGISDTEVPAMLAGDVPALREVLRACRDSNPKPSDSELAALIELPVAERIERPERIVMPESIPA